MLIILNTIIFTANYLKNLFYLFIFAVLIFTLSAFVIPDAHATASMSCSPLSGPGRATAWCTASGLSVTDSCGLKFLIDGVPDGSCVTIQLPYPPFNQIGTGFNFPDTPGVHTLTLSSPTNYVSQDFTTLTPTFSVSQTSGPVGTIVTITGSNWSIGNWVSITYDGSYTGSSVTADYQGNFQTTFTIPASLKGDHVIGVANYIFSGTQTFTVTGTGSDTTTTEISADSTNISPGGQTTITATVTDTLSASNPTGTVTFNDGFPPGGIPPPLGFPPGTGGTFSPTSCNTSGNNQLVCTTTYTASNTLGPVTIHANYVPDNLNFIPSSGTSSLTITTNTIVLSIVAPGTDKIVADGSSKITLQATLTQDNQPVSGKQLLFQTSWPDMQNHLSSTSPITTDSNGQASVTFSSPNGFNSNAPGFSLRNTIRSAAFDVTVTTTDNAASASKTITLFQTPVLLVHGTWSDSSTWNQSGASMVQWLQQKGYDVTTMDYNSLDDLSSSGAVVLQNKLAFIRNTMASQGITDSKVDVVAHSQGGLVARYYITSSSYQHDVRNLVMLGTPNLGAAWNSLNIGGFCNNGSILCAFFQNEFPDGFGIMGSGVVEELPGSSFLHNLNLIPSRTDVNYFTIHGLKNKWDVLQSPITISIPSPLASSPADGLVTEQSATDNFNPSWVNYPGLNFANHIQLTNNISAMCDVDAALIKSSNLCFTVHSPVNILVTDPTGKKIGFDSQTNSDVNEISNAIYSGNSGVEGSQGVVITDPLPGQYKIDAVGTGNGNYTISENLLGGDGIVQSQQYFQGQISTGQSVEYHTTTNTNNRALTTTVLTASANPSSVGQSVVFTTMISSSSGTPTGTVTFFDEGILLGTSTLINGQTTFNISSLSQGIHSIIAVYGGDTNYASSMSSVLTQTVTKTPTQATQDLVSLVDGMHLKKGTTESLDEKLKDVIKDFAKGHNDDARKDLKDFINKVKDQTGKSISTAQSTQLTSAAQAIIDALPNTDKGGHDKDHHDDKDSK